MTPEQKIQVLDLFIAAIQAETMSVGADILIEGLRKL